MNSMDIILNICKNLKIEYHNGYLTVSDVIENLINCELKYLKIIEDISKNGIKNYDLKFLFKKPLILSYYSIYNYINNFIVEDIEVNIIILNNLKYNNFSKLINKRPYIFGNRIINYNFLDKYYILEFIYNYRINNNYISKKKLNKIYYKLYNSIKLIYFSNVNINNRFFKIFLNKYILYLYYRGLNEFKYLDY